MQILYNPSVIDEKRYCFHINTGGDLNIKINGIAPQVNITFVDRKLYNVEFSGGNFEEIDESTRWHIYGAVAQEIDRISEKLNTPTAAGAGS